MPVLVLSQYVEQMYARELMLSGPPASATSWRTASHTSARSPMRFARWPAVDTVLDPAEVTSMLSHRDRSHAMVRLTEREREVLALMAESRSNAAIAARLVVTPKAVDKAHQLDLHEAGPAA
jgi:DNA-binding CsgD family transcriptional regulator